MRKLARIGLSSHPEHNRLTTFRDKTYTFEAGADEYHIPELRAGVMKGYKRCASGKLKMMGITDMSGMLAWDTTVATGFENFCLLYEHGVPMTTGNDTVAPCTPAMVGLDLLIFDHVFKSNPERKLFSGAEAARSVTIKSARSLGLEEEFGSLEIGTTADLGDTGWRPAGGFPPDRQPGGGFVHGRCAGHQQLRPQGGTQRESTKLRKNIVIARCLSLASKGLVSYENPTNNERTPVV